MANLIAIMGESGSGKTTSLRNLDPETTYIIDCDKKGLAWLGWRKQYNEQRHNYRKTDDQDVVMKCLKAINKPESNVKVVVVDTINGIMVADENRRRAEKGYDKWADLAWAIYDIIDFALTMRDGLTVIFIAHSQTDSDDFGYRFTRIKTSGKKLDKINVESKFSTVLWAKVIDGEHVFELTGDASTAKCPMGMFDDKTIPNDIKTVIDRFEEFSDAE